MTSRQTKSSASLHPASSRQPSSSVMQIPCCLCGTRIVPNAANQCGACLASRVDLSSILQSGPGNQPTVTIHRCRHCRRFARTPAVYESVEMESPELLAICLRHIPALASSSNSAANAFYYSSSSSGSSSSSNNNNKLPVQYLKLVDAGWIWTEPHSMRLRLRLTVRAEIEAVPVQQTVQVEQVIAWQMCPDCNRQYTNREWQAIVQLRQHRSTSAGGGSGGGGGGPDHGGSRRGLAALEMAIARNKSIRRNVIKMNARVNGFDFYFLHLSDALGFASYLQRVAPMRVKTSQKYVSSEGHTKSVANVKHTVACDVLPLCKHDLIAVHRRCPSKLAGRLALVTKVSSTVHLVDAAPSNRNADPASLVMELGPDAFYKNEKDYRVLQSSRRLARFVVLDVELCNDSRRHHHHHRGGGGGGGGGEEDFGNSTIKPALADVVVARESEWGVPDPTIGVAVVDEDDEDGAPNRQHSHLTALSAHLGNLLQPGDTVLGYDLSTTVGGDWELEKFLHSGVLTPDVVLVQKVAAANSNPTVSAPPETTVPSRRRRKNHGEEVAAPDGGHHALEGIESPAVTGEKPSMTKKMARRRRRKEGKKSRDLEESAIRMGFVQDEEVEEAAEGEWASEPAEAGLQGDGWMEDAELAAEVAALEKEFASMDLPKDAADPSNGGDVVAAASQCAVSAGDHEAGGENE